MKRLLWIEGSIKYDIMFICYDGSSHIDKLNMMCTFYKLLDLFLSLSYGFGMVFSWLMMCVHLVFPDYLLPFIISRFILKQ